MVVYIFAFAYRNVAYKADNPIRRYFIPALTIKLLGSLAVVYVYTFIYHGYDTYNYFDDSRVLWRCFQDNYFKAFSIIWNPAIVHQPETYDWTRQMLFFRDPSSFMVDKIAGVISFYTFHTFTSVSIFFGVLSFSGVWAMFRLFTKLYPDVTRQLAFAILFIPSVIFWGSGLLKDTITFGALGWLVFSSYNLFIKPKKVLSNALVFFISSYFIITIKPYIVFCYYPALVFWIFFSFRERFKSEIFKKILAPFLVIITIGAGYAIVQQLGKEIAKYSVTEALTTAQSFQTYHTYLGQAEGASAYSLGAYDPSFWGILTKFPAAVNVTLFRPYPWEAHNFLMLVSSIESAVQFIFLLYIMRRSGIFRTIRVSFSNPDAFFCFFFSIFFAFAVGFTAYNFGALVRYKIPCIPFFIVGLILLNRQAHIDKVKHDARIKHKGLLIPDKPQAAPA